MGEEEVQEAEEAGARKRKRGAGGEAEDEDDDAGAEDAAEGGAYEKDLLGEDGGEGIAEEAVAEVMRWLEAEIAGSPPPGSPGFVTINGNEESCGPSFSAAASTVMASVDTRAGAPPPPPVPWPWPDPVPAAGGGVDADADAAGAPVVVDVEMGTGGEADEEWLARLLTCGGPLLEGVL
ncbi:hypothetical protein C2845_PM07G37500 [Panicum miliaceum]|uniref:Uncharacterized protein n=1 Tax=Panicum miliaceum TaxID=4540 RepID=A0A3L6SI37_PANMI|nr:hypothetical protein C2845_PM07G37500 [Panicum miliaceum]